MADPRDLCSIKPNQLQIGMWFSTTETNITQTNAFIPSTANGYDSPVGASNVMQRLAQAVTTSGGIAIQASPYSSRLRPLTNLDLIYGAEQVILRKLEFLIFDTTLGNGTTSTGVGQDSETLKALEASFLTTSNAYAASRFRNARPPDWQPNYHRPSFVVNGVNILGQLNRSGFDPYSNLGDLSIGLPGHCCYDFTDMPMDLDKINPDIQVFGGAQQMITRADTTVTFLRYPELVVAEFIIFQ